MHTLTIPCGHCAEADVIASSRGCQTACPRQLLTWQGGGTSAGRCWRRLCRWAESVLLILELAVYASIVTCLHVSHS